MQISKTTKIGFWVVLCLVVLIWGFNFLKGRDIFRNENIFYARYNDVSGLTPSTSVTLNGFKIGYVRDIYFAEDLSGDLIVQIAVQNEFPLPVGTTAEIASTDLLGSRVMKINLGHGDKLYQSNDTLLSKLEFDIKEQVGEQLAPIKMKAERLLESLDSMVQSTTRIMSPEVEKDIKNSIDQFSMTMTNLSKISKDLSEVIGDQKTNLKGTISNFNETAANLKENSGQLSHMMNNLSTFSDSLSLIELDKINSSIKNLDLILSKIEESNGTLGRLVNDPSLYQNLDASLENLRALLIDFRMNPKRYVSFSAFDFGRDIVLNPTQEGQVNESVVFKVFLFSSPTPIIPESPIFKGVTNIEEIKSGRSYHYFVGNESSIDKVREILIKTQHAFPEATLKAFKNGKEISMKKALKTISK